MLVRMIRRVPLAVFAATVLLVAPLSVVAGQPTRHENPHTHASSFPMRRGIPHPATPTRSRLKPPATCSTVRPTNPAPLEIVVGLVELRERTYPIDGRLHEPEADGLDRPLELATGDASRPEHHDLVEHEPRRREPEGRVLLCRCAW